MEYIYICVIKMLLFLFLMPVKTVAAVFLIFFHHPDSEPTCFNSSARWNPCFAPAPNHRCLFCMASLWTLPDGAAEPTESPEEMS